MKRIAVLLSTYNGEKYLPEQMASLLVQQGVEIRIFVRDDGSRDSTVAMVEALAQQHPCISLDRARNVGVIKSFFALLQQAGDDFDYYAFCDQDDVWDHDKLLAAAQQLEGVTQPALYCSALRYVDAELRPLGVAGTAAIPSFGNALIENIATGCTSVVNAPLRQLLISYLPRQTVMHDWWIYLVATAFGTVVFDPQTHMGYRQHGGNAIGGSASSLEMWRRRLRRFLTGKGGAVWMQAAEFQAVYGDRLTPEKQLLLQRFVAAKSSFFMRLLLVCSAVLRRQSRLDTVVFKILIMAGRF